MMDFTSSLYLGMKHSSKELDGWQQLTTGKPAILGEARIAKQVAREIAALQGLEKGLVAPSTIHLYYDLFDWLSHQPVRVYIDEKVYPVSRYGIEKLLLRKIPVYYFRHMDAQHLSQLMAQPASSGARPVIITDGWCPACGRPAPVQQYAAMVKPYKGWVVVDDTQAIGVLGHNKQAGMPLGSGGGGLLPWLSVPTAQVMTIVSLAKGLGVPMAVVSGSRRTIEAFADNSRTRINASPVSMAHLQAAMNALCLNRQEGDARRASLSRNIRLLRAIIQTAGIRVNGSLFPVQSIVAGTRQQTITLYEALAREKIRAVMVTPHWQTDPALSVIIRSDHTPRDIHKLAAAIIRHHTHNKPIEHGNLFRGNFIRAGNSRSGAHRQTGS